VIDPITVELIGSTLRYASEEMGIAVRDAAYSANIKERLDHSCALFDADGALVAQAEHIPVHLGSLPWGLRRTLAWLAERNRRIERGEMIVVSDPYLSGTHLNDVTLIRAIYFGDALVGYAANKAHHTDVGGSVPGSMPPDARDLFAEGCIVPPTVLVRDDRVVDEIVEWLRANSRTPTARAGDVRAQVAGNLVGERRYLELVDRYGAATVSAALRKTLADGERRTRAALAELPDATVEHSDVLEDERGEATIVLRVRLTKRGETLELDYTGTSPQVPLPLNAVYGVTLSGVYYAVRAVTDPHVPTSDGSFRPIAVYVPEGSLLNPRRPAPVSAGNVETSMRNADLVLGAFAKLAPGRVPAQSGGSMNNVSLGGIDARGRSWAFYETNGCGMGARPTADGIDAIHAHMTNTLNTPIEAMERDMPIRIDAYEFVAGTGGAGEFRGGCGLRRTFVLREGTATASLLAERHAIRPAGALGGCSGTCGSHTLVRADGTSCTLDAKGSVLLNEGDAITIETAGGGGYGAASARARSARDADRRNQMITKVIAAKPLRRASSP